MSKRNHPSDQVSHDASDSGPPISLRPTSKVRRQSTLQCDMNGFKIKSPAVSGNLGYREGKSTTKLTKPPKVGTTSAPTEAESGKNQRCDPSSKNVQEFKHLFNQMLKTKNPAKTLEQYADPAFRDIVAYVNPAMLPWLSEAIEEARAALLENGEVE